MKIIKKIKLQNFKRFGSFTTEFNNELNLLIGDNEAGKSTILSAIDIVLSGSRSKVETLGLESLLNMDVVDSFLDSDKNYDDLPSMFVELHLSELDDYRFNGDFNSDGQTSDGIQLICKPQDELSDEIREILTQPGRNFPYEYYSITFKTFSGELYTGYRRPISHVLLDSTQINNERATRSYIKTLYNSTVDGAAEKNKHHNEYRNHKTTFKDTILSDVNDRVTDYEFTLKTSSKANLETDLTISEGNIPIENKGKGRQCFIKTEFALMGQENRLNVILLEEPENHLSHTHMNRLIQRINQSKNKQLFIATHSGLISVRLDLRRSILLNSNSTERVLLKDLEDDTAKFFMKAPDNNILEFILSPKVILVEGDAEYVLMETFFQKVAGTKPEDIHIISVDGTSFKRYLELAKTLGIKTAVIRDNDKDYQTTCIERYEDYVSTTIKVFADEDPDRYTFEVAMYEDNTAICDGLFLKGRRSLSVQQYMLKNKAEVAFQLLDKKASELACPEYIKDAIQWINE